MIGFSSRVLLFFSIALIVGACATKVLKYEKVENLEKIEEYDKMIEVKPIEQPLPPSLSEGQTGSAVFIPPAPETVSGKSKKIKKVIVPKPPVPEPQRLGVKREPPLEDSEGFVGRRPNIDPYRVGEKVTLDVTYLNLTAGQMDMVVGPYVEVNGEQAYNFSIGLKTSSFFSSFYSVDDRAITFVNFLTMLPFNLTIHVKESKQLSETRLFLDNKKLKANYWQKKFTQDKGEVNKKLSWDILPYSQNVISAIFYLRAFTLYPGKKIAFRVADDGKNIVFKAEVLRREKIDTVVGELDTVVIRPEFQVDGVFKPVGEILFWLTDDERKFIVKIDAKIKIGTLKAKLALLEKGI